MQVNINVSEYWLYKTTVYFLMGLKNMYVIKINEKRHTTWRGRGFKVLIVSGKRQLTQVHVIIYKYILTKEE